MTEDHDGTVALEELARLPPLAPDAARSERARRLCRVRLVRNAERRRGRANRIAFAGRVAAPFVIGILNALYAAALMSTTLRLVGFIQ
jgi:hypothetical protein